MGPSADPVVRCADLEKRYGAVQAVGGVTFDVARSEVFGLLGPNGAGKTTTVEILEGLRPPDGGTATVLGIDVARRPGALKQHIGVQLQTAALYPNLTVRELVELFASFYRSSRPPRDVIAELDLGEKEDALTKDLSGGQRQRLSVALALINDPELLFLDEPTTGMDPQARRSLWGLVERQRERGKTIVLTTHYMEEAERLCDRVAIMDHGRILELGTVDELVSRRFRERAIEFDAVEGLTDDRLAALPAVSRVARDDDRSTLYTSDVATTIGALLRATADAGVEPGDLAIRHATLEDVFLDLTGRALRD